MLIILILTAITLSFGILVYVANRLTTRKAKGIEKTGEAASPLPETDCGTCVAAGCLCNAREMTDNTAKMTEDRLTNPLLECKGAEPKIL